ncbi:MAG TPA: hypothetical protein VN026_16140 [Bacteroidia bacterium]|nr:hypothetical protein [Bacteroidia bacterium]
MLKRIFIFILFSSFAYSCIKPYACECSYVYTNPIQKSHTLVYANKKNKNEACAKQGRDTSVVCKVKE